MDLFKQLANDIYKTDKTTDHSNCYYYNFLCFIYHCNRQKIYLTKENIKTIIDYMNTNQKIIPRETIFSNKDIIKECLEYGLFDKISINFIRHIITSSNKEQLLKIFKENELESDNLRDALATTLERYQKNEKRLNQLTVSPKDTSLYYLTIKLAYIMDQKKETDCQDPEELKDVIVKILDIIPISCQEQLSELYIMQRYDRILDLLLEIRKNIKPKEKSNEVFYNFEWTTSISNWLEQESDPQVITETLSNLLTEDVKNKELTFEEKTKNLSKRLRKEKC